MPSRMRGRSESAAKAHRKTNATAPILDSTDFDAAIVHIAQQRFPARKHVALRQHRVGFSR